MLVTSRYFVKATFFLFFEDIVLFSVVQLMILQVKVTFKIFKYINEP